MKYRYDLEDGNWVIVEKTDKDDDLNCSSSWGSSIKFTIKESQLEHYISLWETYARENKAAMLATENNLKRLGFKRVV